MAYKTLKYYSTTAASNATINGTNYFPEGQAPSTVNDAARQTMADLAAFYQAMYATFQARLTLTTATPVTTGDVTGAGTIYLTPYKGNQIWLYDGSAQWNLFNLTEISLSLSLTSGKPYDIFCYDNSGSPALESLVWTNDSTRATALTFQDGIYVKSGATTRRYVGTIYSTGANTTEDSISKRYVWNYYNRVPRYLSVIDSTDTWPYTTAAYQQARAAATNQVEIVVGVAEDSFEASVFGRVSNDNANVRVAVGVGIDSTSANSAQIISSWTTQLANIAVNPSAHYRGIPAAGRHTVVWLERSAATGTSTWQGDGGSAADIQSGLIAQVMA